MLARYIRSHPVHLLEAKPPLTLKFSDAPGSQRLGLSYLYSTFSHHSYFLHSHTSSIRSFSATLSFLHWCVWGGMLTARVEEPTDRVERTRNKFRKSHLQLALPSTIYTPAKIKTPACSVLTVDLWRPPDKNFWLGGRLTDRNTDQLLH